MRKVAILLIVAGLAGLALGSIAIVRTATDPGAASFSHENYGGPGPIIGALLLLLGGVYLFSSARRED
jgi:hypothetical protein